MNFKGHQLIEYIRNFFITDLLHRDHKVRVVILEKGTVGTIDTGTLFISLTETQSTSYLQKIIVGTINSELLV